MADRSLPIQPVYLLVDASGSTARAGFNRACNLALPALIGQLEQTGNERLRLGILTFSARAELLLALSDVRSMQFLPEIPATGVSVLAAGLQLLADTIHRDAQQLAADGFATSPALVAIVTDGMPCDAPDVIRAAYQGFRALVTSLVAEVLVVVGEGEVAPVVAGLGQGLSEPRVTTLDLPVVDGDLLAGALAGWMLRARG